MNTHNDFGFVKVATAIPKIKIADCEHNISHIEQLMDEADQNGASVIVFPELCITGYTCGELFRSHLLIQKALEALGDAVCYSEQLSVAAIVGLPLRVDNQLFNCAVVIYRGRIVAVVPKNYLPEYNEFYEMRWFASAFHTDRQEITLLGQEHIPFGQNIVIKTPNFSYGIEICEDLWTPIPPSSILTLAGGAQLIFNMSASNELIGKHEYLKKIINNQSAKTISGYIYSSAGFGESSTDVVYAGNAIISERGTIIGMSDRFSLETQIVYGEIDIEQLLADRQNNSTFRQATMPFKLKQPIRYTEYEQTVNFTPERKINPLPFIPSKENMRSACEEIFQIQVSGLVTRLYHTGIKTMVLGISGGLDSTLALLVCAKACDRLGLDRKNIIGVTMPGFGTTKRTYTNAVEMIRKVGATFKEISIKDACIQHFNDIEHDIDIHDVTYENGQARERTQILMDLANKYCGFVIGTGDLSELALGWATYNGDHMSMYAVNVGVPKTLVKYMVEYAANYEMDEALKSNLLDVVDTPVSPELLPANSDGTISQKTEDLVGPYELHDFFIYYTIRYGFTPKKIQFLAERAFGDKYDKETIKHWLSIFCRRFFNQQFKRSCMPDGVKVGSVCLSPRGDWRMPSDASSRSWINDLE